MAARAGLDAPLPVTRSRFMYSCTVTSSASWRRLPTRSPVGDGHIREARVFFLKVLASSSVLTPAV